MTFTKTYTDRYECLWFLEGKGPEDVVPLLVETFSPHWLEGLKTEAIGNGDMEVAELISEAQKWHLETFEISFPYPGKKNNSGRVVRFHKSGKDYYHIDFKFNRRPEGQQVMLYRLPTGAWQSDHSSFNNLVVEAISSTLDKHAKKMIGRKRRQRRLSKLLSSYRVNSVVTQFERYYRL